MLVSTGDPAPAPDLTALAQGRPVFTAVHQPRSWRPLGGTELRPPEALAGRPALAFCGLGRPDSFQRTLNQLGLDIRRFLALADHQTYSRRVLAGLALAFTASGAEFMVTTAKDAVKLPPSWPWPVLVLQTELRLDDPQAFFQAVLTTLNHDRQIPG
jgi:tetraacyldisaccharide 4'-kinase